MILSMLLRITFALAAPMLVTAAVADTPRLRPAVTVTGETVRLGDLVERAGDAADVPVFAAPAPGQAGVISVARALEAARDHGLQLSVPRGTTSIRVERLGRAITEDLLLDALRAHLVGRHGVGPEAEIELTGETRAFAVETEADGPLDLGTLTFHAHNGRFEVMARVAGSRLVPVRITGSVTDMVRLPVLARAVQRGELVTADHLRIERRRRADLAPDQIVDPQRLVGFAARRAMGMGSTLRDADVQRPELVERNGAVLMTYEQGGLSISTRGRALSGGGLGDTLTVQNVQSRKIVEAIVTGPARVRVTGVVLGEADRLANRNR